MKESRGITPLRTILQNCLNHIENLETNRSISDNYDKEFQDLKQFSETLKAKKEYSCTEGEKEVNRKKNRYKDILPFNVSRVILSEYAGIPGSDYINANFIKGASGSPAYIASQGPLPNTVNDFWRMVVECEVQVIVMACNAQESGKHKCENYWVEKEGEEKRFGMVQICLVKASTVCPDFLVRTMRLKYTNDKDVTEERTVCQFHYSAWPDHGVPPLVRPLLDMVRLVRDTQASETLPVLVHCSAGCGRTGTICAIDFVWGLLRAGKLTEEFSLFNLVKDMRKQRVAMVQTKEQYILVHQAVRELFKEQLRVIESHPYENIDFNGVPLIKDFEEPFYDTISPIQKDEICDEKQDKSEMNDKGEDVEGRINKMDAAPPLPRKKRPNVLFSKQEKEAENLTEKNRSSFAEKERDRTDASLSSLLGKPRIVKLRALFEKSPATKERTGLKDKGSQTVSRSHSLGAIRKPLTTEVFEPQVEKSKPSSAPSPPTSDFTKLKNSKSFSKSVPLIKRSKSLKSFSQPANLCISTTSKANDYKTVKNYHPRLYEVERPMAIENERTLRKFTATCDIVEVSGLAKECSKRRRSLESLMGDGPPSITWPTVVMSVEKSSSNNHKGRERGLEWSSKLSTGTVPGSLTADTLKHQLQRLSLETEKKMNSFVSGIGVRERRNSFRQAVNKSDIRSVFRDRESHGFASKKLLANESALTHRNGSHSKNMKNANEISPMVDQPDGVVYLEREAPHDVKLSVAKSKSIFDVKKYKLQEKPSVSGEGQAPVPVKRVIARHPQQNSLASNHIILEPRTSKGLMAPKNSKSEEPDRTGESKNLFLKKLNSEIYERERDGESNEPRSRSNFDESDKTARLVSGSGLVRSDSKKTIFRTNAIKPAGSFCSSSDNFDEMDSSRSAEASNPEKIFQSSAWQNSKSNPSHQTYVNVSKPLKPFECYKCYTNSSPIHPTSYGKAVHSHKSIPYQNSSGESSSNLRRDEAPHKESFFLGSHKKNVCSVVPPKSNSGHDSEASFSSYRKNHTSNSDMPVYVTVGSEFEINDKNLPLPPKMTTAGKISKNYDSIPWSHPVASRSSGEMSSSEHSSDSSRLLPQYEVENHGKTEVKVIKITEQAKGINKSRLSDSSEVTASKQKRPEELKQNSSVDFCNYGVFGTSKPKQSASKYSKDDFLLEEPTAPPRVKRHASVTVPRNTLNGSDHAAPWVSAEKKFGNSRSASLQAENAWNGSIGVDLDAVAASMQQDKSLTTLKDWSAKNPLNSSTNSTVKKKQHYL